MRRSSILALTAFSVLLVAGDPADAGKLSRKIGRLEKRLAKNKEKAEINGGWTRRDVHAFRRAAVRTGKALAKAKSVTPEERARLEAIDAPSFTWTIGTEQGFGAVGIRPSAVSDVEVFDRAANGFSFLYQKAAALGVKMPTMTIRIRPTDRRLEVNKSGAAPPGVERIVER